MSQKTRIKKLEQESFRHQKVILCVGIKYIEGTVGSESERNYQEFLKSGIEGPFIWINMMRPANKNHTEVICENKEPN